MLIDLSFPHMCLDFLLATNASSLFTAMLTNVLEVLSLVPVVYLKLLIFGYLFYNLCAPIHYLKLRPNLDRY